MTCVLLPTVTVGREGNRCAATAKLAKKHELFNATLVTITFYINNRSFEIWRMTVGIVFSNGLEAILLGDEVLSVASADGTTEDTVTKLGTFDHSNYHGGIVGAGEGNMAIGGILKFSTRQTHENGAVIATHDLDELVKAVRDYAAKKLDADDDEWLMEKMNSARKKAATFPDEPERVKYFEAERVRIFQEYDEAKHQQMHSPPVLFLIAAYDGINKITRTFSIKGISVEEIHLPHHEIGNGAKAARLYFAESLQGIEPSNLTTPDLAFYTSCAFMKSTIEAGVGGTPRIVFAGEKQARNLDAAAVAALTNVCGYYLAGALTKDEALSFAKTIVQVTGEVKDDNLIRAEVENRAAGLCGKLKTTTHDIVSATLPLSVVYQRVNHNRS